MKKYSLHFVTSMVILAAIAFCKNETIPEYKIAEALKIALSALLLVISDYFPKNSTTKNLILIRKLTVQVAQFHSFFHLKYSCHEN